MEKFEKKEAHPMEKYIGRHVICWGRIREVVGYIAWHGGSCSLIIEASEDEGWNVPGSGDVIIKKCEGYLYADISDLID